MKTDFEYLYDPQSRLQNSFEPVWKNRVDRWYQLDENSFALCEALTAWNLSKWFDSQNLTLSQIFYFIEGGSNLADADFVNADAISPAKFVYTLPNIAISVGLQILNWRGPVYSFCVGLNDDRPRTLLEEGLTQAESADGLCSLVITLGAGLNPGGYRAVNGRIF